MSVATTVICAVWHQDPNRDALVLAHARNLVRQTVPVDVIYVFDGGAKAPADLPGRCITVREPLTIYQSWNVALSLVATPFVMNLNLDDRLAPNAIQTMQEGLGRGSAAAICGDWKVCYSQDETDRVEPCHPASDLPFVMAWPLPSGTLTRLGSGAERRTYGPAVMWRMDVHMRAPRYPWRFADGSLIKVVGDMAWWSILQDHLKAKIQALPLIVGNYHSHPGDQLEFRGNADGENNFWQKVPVAFH